MGVNDDGTRSGEGRTRQEGQPQEGSGQEQVERCQICQLPEGAAHGMKQHVFTPPGVPIDTRQFDRRRNRTPSRGDSPSRGILPPQRTSQTPQTTAPFDPVLRMALIDAGIITVEQLREAGDKISMFTQLVTQDGPVLREAGNAE